MLNILETLGKETYLPLLYLTSCSYKQTCSWGRHKPSKSHLGRSFRGLNRISMARSMNKLEAIYLIHYVYGWLGTYSKTHIEQPHHHNSHTKMARLSGEKINQTPNAQEAQELLKCNGLSIMYFNALLKDTSMGLTDIQCLSQS